MQYQDKAVVLRLHRERIERHRLNYIDVCRRLDLLKAELKQAKTQTKARSIISEMKHYKRIRRYLETKSRSA